MTSSIIIPGYNPSNRVPGFYFSLDNSKANTASGTRRVLLMGQMLDANKEDAPKSAILSLNLADAVNKYGSGSQIVTMLKAYRQLDNSGEVWTLGIADADGSAPAKGQITVTGTANQAGTIALYINDILVPVGVSTGDTADIITQSILSAVKNNPDIPVSMAAVSAPSQSDAHPNMPVNISVTALNKGLVGNNISLNINLLGNAGGQSLPNGIGVTFTQLTGGTQNPLLDEILSLQNSRVYDLIAHPYTDVASLTSFKAWLDNMTGRWQPTKQLYGQTITAFKGTYGEALALKLKNDPHTSIMPTGDSATSIVKWAAFLTAQTAVSMRENPALPVKGFAIPALAPSDAFRFDFDERNQLLHSGLSTFTVGDDGTPYIERIVTTYTENNQNNPDDSYLDIETLLTAEICLQDLQLYLAKTFPRNILLPDGAKIPVGVPATTCAQIKAYVIARYSYQCDQCWADDLEFFAENVAVEYAGKGNVRMLLPYKFADQLWAIAGNCQFLPNT